MNPLHKREKQEQGEQNATGKEEAEGEGNKGKKGDCRRLLSTHTHSHTQSWSVILLVRTGSHQFNSRYH